MLGHPILKIITAVAVALAAVHIIWPDFGIDAITVTLLLLAALPWLLPYLKSVELPGGLKIELKDVQSAAEQVIEGSRKVIRQAPGRAADNTRSLQQIEFLEDVGDRDPNLMLIGFRIEIEKRLREFAKLNRYLHHSGEPLSRLITTLRDNQMLPDQVASGLSDLISLGNKAAHGADVSSEAASWVLSVGAQILGSLDALISAAKEGKGTN